MNANRLWVIGAVVAIIAILGGAVGLGVQPHFAAAAAADAATGAAQTQNDTTGTEISRLTRVAATQSKLDETARELQNAVPPSLRANSLSRMLRQVAAIDGVTVEAFSPAEPITYAPTTSDGTAPTTAAASSSTSSSSSTPSPAPTATATVAPVDPKSPWFGKTEDSITAGNFTVVPLTVTVKGSEAAVLAFAADVQKQARLFAVTTVSTTRDEDSGTSTGVVSGYTYTLAK